MRSLFVPLFAASAFVSTVSAATQKYVDFEPSRLWLDDKGVHINAHGGGILFDNGKYYWFGEHKVGGDVGNYAQVGVHCYSSKDLMNWKDEGIALPVVEDDPNHPIAKGCILERPKVVFNKKTGKYVMWFHLELKGKGYGAAYSGTAVADKVTGPYKFVKAGRINPKKWPLNMPKEEQNIPSDHQTPQMTGSFFPEGSQPYAFLKRDFEGGQMARDMTVFVDDDDKAYHIYSSEENGTMHIAELTDDYQGHTGKYIRIFPGRFMEAPAICKRNGKYYLIASGCSGWAPNKARSGVADSIMGEWKELNNPCVGDNAEITFGSQSTFIIPVQGKKDEFIFMADEWRPKDAIDGRYIWIPMVFEGDQIKLENKKSWALPKES